MTETDPKPGDQTGAEAQEHDPEIGPGTQPGDDGDETGSAGGRP